MKLYNFLYQAINIVFSFFILRFISTKLAIALMKRVGFDLRFCWDHERLYFLNKKVPFKAGFIRLYYLLTPVGYGLSWGCAMESAYRIINISKTSCLSSKLLERYLDKERRFILNNLEVHSNNNHIFFNIIGILIANKLISNVDDELEWKLAFINECQAQFNEDGTNFEASTNYHLVMLEAICHLISVRPEYLSIVLGNVNINGAISFIDNIENEYGISLVGDNDDGMCIKSSRDERVNRKAQVTFIKETFNNSANKVLQRRNYFNDFGVFFYNKGEVKLSLWNPKNGQSGKCGHNHNDNHSIQFALEGKEFIVDPGVFYYNLKRDYFRDEQNHSTINSSCAGFNKFKGNFSREAKSITELHYSEKTVKTTLQMDPLFSERTIEIEGNSFIIKDKVQSKSTITSSLIISEFVTVSKFKNGLLLSRGDCSKKLYLTAELNTNIKIVKVFISPSYSYIRASNKILLTSTTNQLTWKITTL